MGKKKPTVVVRFKKEQKPAATINPEEYRLYYDSVVDNIAGLRELLNYALEKESKDDPWRAAFALVDRAMNQLYELTHTLVERLRAESKDKQSYPTPLEHAVRICEEDVDQNEQCLMPLWGLAAAADSNDMGELVSERHLFACAGFALTLAKKVSEEGVKVLRFHLQEGGAE